MGWTKLHYYVMSATFVNPGMASHPGQLDNRAGFQAHHCGSSSLGQSCGGHRNMRNSRMNRYTIANTSEFQRFCIPYTLMHTAQTIVTGVDLSHFRKSPNFWAVSLAGSVSIRQCDSS